MNVESPSQIDVLLVDDEPRVASALAFALEGSEMHLRSASNEEEMWRAIDEVVPAIVVLDLQLGPRSGLEVCARIRGRVDTARLPIVALSGFADPKVKGQAFDAGFDDYIVKPFSPEELLVRIRAHVRRSH